MNLNIRFDGEINAPMKGVVVGSLLGLIQAGTFLAKLGHSLFHQFIQKFPFRFRYMDDMLFHFKDSTLQLEVLKKLKMKYT